MEENLDGRDLPIVRDTYRLIDYYDEPVYKQLPNWVKHSVTVLILNQALKDLLFYLTSAAKQNPKLPILNKADATFDCVRFGIRELDRKHWISSPQHEQMAKYLKSIGDQLGGWIKSLRR